MSEFVRSNACPDTGGCLAAEKAPPVLAPRFAVRRVMTLPHFWHDGESCAAVAGVAPGSGTVALGAAVRGGIWTFGVAFARDACACLMRPINACPSIRLRLRPLANSVASRVNRPFMALLRPHAQLIDNRFDVTKFANKTLKVL